MSKIGLNPITAAVDTVSRGIETVAGVFTTNKEKQAQRAQDEQLALLRAYQAEFNQRENRTWIDAFADGFNRLVRPMIVCLVLFIFIIAYVSPSHLAEITLALSSIPDGYWTLLSVIIVFYFGGRMQLKSQQFRFNESQAQAIKALIEAKQSFRQLEIDDDEPDRLVGESSAKSHVVEAARNQQVNEVISTALEVINTDVNQGTLTQKVEEMQSESVESVKKRRKLRFPKRHR